MDTPWAGLEPEVFTACAENGMTETVPGLRKNGGWYAISEAMRCPAGTEERGAYIEEKENKVAGPHTGGNAVGGQPFRMWPDSDPKPGVPQGEHRGAKFLPVQRKLHSLRAFFREQQGSGHFRAFFRQQQGP